MEENLNNGSIKGLAKLKFFTLIISLSMRLCSRREGRFQRAVAPSLWLFSVADDYFYTQSTALHTHMDTYIWTHSLSVSLSLKLYAKGRWWYLRCAEIRQEEEHPSVGMVILNGCCEIWGVFLSFCSSFIDAAKKGFSFLVWLRNTSDLSLVASLPDSFLFCFLGQYGIYL